MIPGVRVGRVFAHAAPTDLRRGFDGLSALVVEHLGRQATSGDLYLFVSRDRVRAKVLWWDGTGLCVYAKRLEQGRFAALWGRVRDGQVELSAAELALFLEGCREVGHRRLSPPAVDPQRKVYLGAVR
jgi:transposase